MFAAVSSLRERVLALIAVALLTTAPRLRAVEIPAPATAADWPRQRGETFQRVWSTVNEVYFDPTFGGVDWNAVGARYRAQLGSVTDNELLRELLNAMLAELRRSHFAVLPRELTVFEAGERHRIGTTGAEIDVVDGRVVVSEVPQDSAAAKAGLRRGMIVRRVDGLALETLVAGARAAHVDAAEIATHLAAWVNAKLHGAVGTPISLEGIDAEGRPFAVTVTSVEHTGSWSEPVGNFPSLPVQFDARRAEDGVAYLRLNAFAPAIIKPARTFLRSLKSTDGLIIDLRGNPGGLSDVAVGLGGWLFQTEVSLGTLRLRRGGMTFPVYPQEGSFAGPIAVLVDGRSASTSEILAAGLRDHGRARLFGERTAGAALPSAFLTLPTGDLLQYVLADLRRPNGAALEGNGVEPDERVVRTLEDVTAGRDPVLDAARAWLKTARDKTK